MTVPRAMELIRNWCLLVEHDMRNDELAHLAIFMSSESEREKWPLIEQINELEQKLLSH